MDGERMAGPSICTGAVEMEDIVKITSLEGATERGDDVGAIIIKAAQDANLFVDEPVVEEDRGRDQAQFRGGGRSVVDEVILAAGFEAVVPGP